MKSRNITSYFSGLLLLIITFTSCTKNFDEQLVQQQPESAIQPSATTTSTGTETIKTINVNIFGGTNGFTATTWNNWNTSASLTSSAFRYSDGTSSTVTAAIGSQVGVSDNGTGYTTTMAPKEVGRYASFSTSTRNLTLSGLDSTKTYELDIYASRAGTSNNTTRFTVESKIIDVKTDNNLATPALFTSLKSSAGKIVVRMDKLNTYTYINGFSLREKSGTTDVITTPDTVSPVETAPAGKVYTLQRNPGGAIYYPDASSQGWKGGDTLRIPAGNYNKIVIGNFQGNETSPIVIINHGGQVTATHISFDNNATYFKLSGTGDPATTYGFKVHNTGDLVGVGIGLAHHVEVCNVEVSGAASGLFFKKNPNSSDPRTIAPNYVLSNFYIHHNYIHDVKTEGLYIGHTAPDGDPALNNLRPLRMDKVEIAYNIVANTGWDGIQLSNARSGAKIHHNKITNYGVSNAGNQQAGIIIGGNTTGDIYDNEVSKGTGNGIQAFGYGTIRIYNNIVENAGANGTTQGAESVFANDLITQTETNPKQQILFYNNTIKYPKSKGGLRVGAYKSNSLPSSITNNTVYLPNAPADWLKWYLVTNVTGSTISGNTVIR